MLEISFKNISSFDTGHRCDNHWGLPHILQHMIFLGSKNFPYPGILDQLAVKCLAEGTDAWTETDHACYTLKTAGKTGFLTLLPVYLDHLFHPNLSEAGYLTEVHHIAGDGKDGGIVYQEMKAMEHDPEQQAHWAIMQEIYKPNSGNMQCMIKI
jgi:Zn-dependent M16 (insulinase) family peptidase